MQVYRIQPHKSYTYGSALVAAKSTQEAIMIYCYDDWHKYKYEDYACTCNPVTGLDYETSVPHIIFDDTGSE